MRSQKAVARAESLNLSNGVQSSIGAVHLPELDTSLDPLVIGRFGGIMFGRSARTDIVDLLRHSSLHMTSAYAVLNTREDLTVECE